jgi:hypothetical protein
MNPMHVCMAESNDELPRCVVEATCTLMTGTVKSQNSGVFDLALATGNPISDDHFELTCNNDGDLCTKPKDAMIRARCLFA